MTSRGAIGVLGSANMDLVVRVDAFPIVGETVSGIDFRTVPGGKGLNQAVAASRAGADVHFVGAVGDDPHGDEIRGLLRREGIDPDSVRVDGTTGTAHILVGPGGENSIVVVPGANQTVRADQVTERLLGEVEWLVSQLELPLDVVIAAMAAARRAGVRTVLTPAPVQQISHSQLSEVDLLVPNEIEACALAGVSDPMEAAVVLSQWCRDVVVTLGARGAVWARGARVAGRVEGRRVQAVDTTAAGDTFVGCLVASLAEGMGMLAALDRASVAASIAVTRPGATTSMPSRAEIDAHARCET